MTPQAPIGPNHRVLNASTARVFAVQMAFGISYSSFLLLPKFLSERLAASASEIGAMAGSSLVAAAVLSPFVGWFAPRFDRRMLLALSLFLEGMAAIGFVFVTHVGPYAYALRLLQGIAFVLVFNCTATLIADQIPKHLLARAVGYLGLSMLATNAIAPVVIEPLAATHGWEVAFALSGGLSLVSLLVIPGLRSVEPGADSVLDPSVPPPSLLSIYYGSFLVGAGIGVLFTFVQPHALAQGAERVGDFFLGYVATAVIVRAIFGGIPDRHGPMRVACYSLVLYALVTAGAALSTPSTLFVLGALLGVSHGFIYPSLTAAGLANVKSSFRPVFMGWFACAFNGGCALSSFALGPVADHYGFSTVFVATGLLLLTGVPLLATARPRRHAATAAP